MTGAATGHIESDPEAVAEAQALAAEGTEAETVAPAAWRAVRRAVRCPVHRHRRRRAGGGVAT